MALTPDEQNLFDAANAAMPPWFKADDRAQEDLGAAAKVMGQAKIIIDHWIKSQAFIKEAVGATSVEPDWLNQHAKDRGTHRQGVELDATLRFRLRALTSGGDPRSITPAAIISLVTEMLANEAVAGTFAIYETPRDAAYMIDAIVQNTGTGGTFSSILVLTFGGVYTAAVPSDVGKTVVQGGNNGVLLQFNNTTKTWWVAKGTGTIVAGVTTITTGTGAGTSTGVVASGIAFLPTVPFAYPPIAPVRGRVKKVRVVISGAASGGNNGTFDVVELVGNSARYVNGSGVAGVDATVSWATQRLDFNNVVTDGFAHSYLYNPAEASPVNGGIADRLSPGALAGILTMLPIGASAALTSAIQEQLRRIKAAGVVSVVERRTV